MGNLWLMLVLLTSSYGFGGAFLAEIGAKGVWQAKRFASFKARGARYSDSSHLLSFQLKTVEDTSMAEFYLRGYIDSSQLKYVISNGKVQRAPIIGDPGAGGQWFHERIGTVKAWETTRGDSSITVAVLDTGMDYNHPSLKDALAVNPREIPGNGIDDDHNGFIDDYLGFDFVNEDSDPLDETSFYNPGQGTHLSGIIAAQSTAESGVFGIAPLTKILPIRILDRNGEGTLGSVVRGIDYAISRGAKIIVAGWSANLSKKGAAPLEAAISRANLAGILVVAAAGNQGRSNDNVDIYPANIRLPNVVSVTSTNQGNSKSSWANFGLNSVSILAPGDNILSTLPKGVYGRVSGTAFSAAVVAGVAALTLSREALSPAEVISRLQQTGLQVTAETLCKCLVNAEESVVSSMPIIYPSFSVARVGQKLKYQVSGGLGPIQVSDSNLAEIDEQGNLVAKKAGVVQLKVTSHPEVKSAELRINR